MFLVHLLTNHLLNYLSFTKCGIEYFLDKGLIHALTIHAEPTLSAHLADKDLFAAALEDSLETQTAGKSKNSYVK